MYSGDETGGIIVDIGTNLSKFGYAGNDSPSSIFSSAVGVSPPSAADASHKTYHVGDAARIFRPGMEVRSPVNYGFVEDWDGLEALLSHGFKQLRADVTEHPLLMSEAVYTPPAQREKMAELVFEKFGAPAWYTARAPVLGAFSAGRASAVVIDIGGGSTRVTPVYDGYVLSKGAHLSEVGGNFITQMMPSYITSSTGMHVLPRYCFKKVPRQGGGGAAAAGADSGAAAPQPPAPFADAPGPAHALPPVFLRSAVTVAPPSAARVFDIVRKDIAGVTRSFHDASVWEVMEDMKRAVLEVHEVGFDPESTPEQVHYELPDGQLLRVKSMRFNMAEAHFRADIVDSYKNLLYAPPFATPALHAIAQAGVITRPTVHTATPHLPLSLPAMVYGALLACTPEVRRDLCQHIVLTGGGSNLKDIHKRLHWEMLAQVPAAFKPRIVAPSPVEREYAGWIGGSILASLGTFQQMWISKAEYEEEGASIVDRKCV